MGIFNWSKSSAPTSPYEQTAQNPAGGKWGKADPFEDPENFVPHGNDLRFQLMEWGPSRNPMFAPNDSYTGVGLANTGGIAVGFAFVFELSDGNYRAAKFVNMGTQKVEWIVPTGQPTGRMKLLSLGDPSTNLIRFVEKCYKLTPSNHPATDFVPCQFITLQGGISNVLPSRARGKIFLDNGRRDSDIKTDYGEFFMSLNVDKKLVWLGDKRSMYGPAIVSWATGQTR